MKQSEKLFALVFIFLLISCTPNEYFKNKYFNDKYKPLKRTLTQKKLPEKYTIKNFRHISYKNAYCNSASLEMYYESKTNDNKAIEYYNFLTGFSYGVYYAGSVYSFIPYTDPEIGLDFASPYLGLKKNYYTTNDSIEFLQNLKELISADMPVRVAVNSAILRLKNSKQFWPHSIILIGYDDAGFSFYETGGEAKDTISTVGEVVGQAKLIKAVSDMGRRFGYPWKYNFTTFTDAKIIESKQEIWRRNGESLIGRKIPMAPLWEGSSAIVAIAKKIMKDGLDKKEQKSLLIWIKTAEYMRKDNARFLRKTYDYKQINQCANELEQAGKKYGEVVTILSLAKLSNDDFNKIGELLMSSSNLEKKAGELMLEISKMNQNT